MQDTDPTKCPAPSRPEAFRLSLAVFAGLLAFHILGSWSLPLIDRDEPRFAEASREMIERNDYVVPHLNDKYRFDKPPLIYWLQTACFRMLGENEFAARLPSAIATALTGLLVFRFGLGFLTPRHAMLAALLYGLCLQSFIHGKAAVADMAMILFLTGSVFTGWRLLRAEPRDSGNIRAGLWLLWALLLAGGFLAKGPVAWLPVATLAVSGFRLRQPLRFHAAWLASLLLAAAIVLVWAFPALQRTDGEFFKVGIGKHVVDRSFNVMEGHGLGGLLGYLATTPLYLLTIFASFFPGSVFLPWLARQVWNRKVAAPLHFYLLANFLAVFAVFSLVSTKLPHYILPGFPFLALLLMLHWQEAGRPTAPLRKWLGGSTAFLALFALVVPPLAAPYFPARQLAILAHDELIPEMEFASAGFEEPSLVWYFRKHVDGFHKKRKISRIAEFMERDGARFAILPSDQLDEAGIRTRPHWKSYRIHGVNVAKGEPVDLTMILKPADSHPPPEG